MKPMIKPTAEQSISMRRGEIRENCLRTAAHHAAHFHCVRLTTAEDSARGNSRLSKVDGPWAPLGMEPTGTGMATDVFERLEGELRKKHEAFDSFRRVVPLHPSSRHAKPMGRSALSRANGMVQQQWNAQPNSSATNKSLFRAPHLALVSVF